MGNDKVSTEIKDVVSMNVKFKTELSTYLNNPKKLVRVARECKEDGYEFVKFSKDPNNWEDEDLYYISLQTVDRIDDQFNLLDCNLKLTNALETMWEEFEGKIAESDELEDVVSKSALENELLNSRMLYEFIEEFIEMVDFEDDTKTLEDLVENLEETEEIFHKILNQ